MNHASVANRVEIVAMATGIFAGLSAAGAAFAEPEGFFAVGVWLGVADEPLVVTAAPSLVILQRSWALFLVLLSFGRNGVNGGLTKKLSRVKNRQMIVVF